MSNNQKVESLTSLENKVYLSIIQKDIRTRAFLKQSNIGNDNSAKVLFYHFASIKDILGNLNNDISFIATLMAKNYLIQRFGVLEFDAAAKPQGASGIDIEIITPSGVRIIGEIKTTKPYQPSFGANQKQEIIKDLDRLKNTKADFKFMFVTNDETFNILQRKDYLTKYPYIETINLTAN